MELFFLDDRRQNSPSREGMGSLIAVGGIRVSGEAVGDLEKAIDSLCTAGDTASRMVKSSSGHQGVSYGCGTT
jgi:hypothetical protein